MKRPFAIVPLLLLAIAGSLFAQDTQRLGEQSLTGTARYVGMGGAMTAVGGDPSAVKDNPAGLGVYRRMEIMLSLDGQYDCTRQVGTDSWYTKPYITVPQFSWVFSVGDPNRPSGVILNNFMFSYQRLHTYKRTMAATAAAQTASLTDVIALKTNGLAATALQPDYRWEDGSIGWLSLLGYDTYLINPKEEGSTEWVPCLSQDETVNNQLILNESGYVNQYALDWAMNISNKWFVGAGVHLQSLQFNRSYSYRESFSQGGNLKNYGEVIFNGLGANATIGVLLHPIRDLRIGASFQTPSITSVAVSNSGAISSVLGDSAYSSSTPSNATSGVRFYLPLRSSVGLAWQWGRYGLISAQYDYSHCSDRDDVHALRLGVEVVPISGLYLNAGYVYQSTFKKSAPLAIGYNSVRTDTDSQNILRTQYISVGIGYRGRSMIAQLAYQFAMQRMDWYAHEYATAYDMQTNTHRIVLTIGWHNR